MRLLELGNLVKARLNVRPLPCQSCAGCNKNRPNHQPLDSPNDEIVTSSVPSPSTWYASRARHWRSRAPLHLTQTGKLFLHLRQSRPAGLRQTHPTQRQYTQQHQLIGKAQQRAGKTCAKPKPHAIMRSWKSAYRAWPPRSTTTHTKSSPDCPFLPCPFDARNMARCTARSRTRNFDRHGDAIERINRFTYKRASYIARPDC